MRHVWVKLLVALIGVLACAGVQDVVAPLVSIQSPADGDSIAAGTVIFRVRAWDDRGLKVVMFMRDGHIVGADSVGEDSVFEVTLDAPADTLAKSCLLTAEAIDSAGNQAVDSAHVVIRGTALVPTYHGGAIRDDEVWLPSGNPHICTTWVLIEAGSQLTVRPGCNVRFAPGAGVSVGHGSSGSLVADGTEDSVITFTSNTVPPRAGDWLGFSFDNVSPASTHLSYCAIEYGGEPGNPVILLNGSIRMDHCRIAYSAGSGIWTGGGHVEDFHDNTITGCASNPICVGAEYMRHFGPGNSFAGNAPGKDFVVAGSGGVSTSGTWPALDVPYLAANINIGSSSAPVIAIEPGAVVLFRSQTGLSVGDNGLPGGLVADSVTFSSVAWPPAPGDWTDIHFGEDAVDGASRLTRCRIEYGGWSYADIHVQSSKPYISQCTIANSSSWGVYLDGDSTELPNADSLEFWLGNTFSGNASGNVRRP